MDRLRPSARTRTHFHTLSLSPSLSERIHVEVTAAWLSVVPGAVAKRRRGV